MTDSTQLEIYGSAPNPGVDSDNKTNFDEALASAGKKADQARQIGMPDLAFQDEEKVRISNVIAWCKARELRPLSDADRDVWTEWLPTGYYSKSRKEKESNNGQRYVWDLQFNLSDRGAKGWAEYSYYEGVPAHVRRLIVEVKDLFTRLEIRTPEKQPVPVMDPVLFGHIEHPNGDRDIVPLARWGESDANLVTFDDIKRIVAVRTGTFKVGKLVEGAGVELLAFAIPGLIGGLALGFGSTILLGIQILIPVFIGLGVTTPLWLWMFHRITRHINQRRLEREHPHLTGMI